MLAGSPAAASARDAGATGLRLVRAEIMKVRTTDTWWFFVLGFMLFTALTLTVNGFSHHYALYPQADLADRAQAVAQAARARTPAGVAAIAASMMTSGQFLGVQFAMLLGVLLMTSEFANHTAASTFLTVPRRGSVVGAKLVAAAAAGASFWLVVTVAGGIVTPVYLASQHVSTALTGWAVVRPVLANLLAFVLWSVFGVGLGALVRSQVAAVIAGVVSYLGGFAALQLIAHLVYDVYPHSWVLGTPVIAPAVASNVMIAAGQAFPHAPPAWAGFAVLAGYALALATAGIVQTRRRDVTA